MSEELLHLNNLSLRYDRASENVVNNISLSVNKSQIVGILGSSGSGKSTLAKYILQLDLDISKITGQVIFGGNDITRLSNKDIRALRGNKIAMIFQNPCSALNPLKTIYKQMVENIITHRHSNNLEQEIENLLDTVGLSSFTDRIHSYPHQLSGGQAQRIMIAMAVANRPKLLIADEPITALDAVVQNKILKLLLELKRKYNASILFISHDINTICKITDYVYVIDKGRIVEHGITAEIFDNPSSDCIKNIIRTSRITETPHFENNKRVVLEGKNINVNVKKKGIFNSRKNVSAILSSINFSIASGDILGIVGESGSGKTTIFNTILGLIRYKGEILFCGNLLDKSIIGSNIQIVFQDPISSLNPRMTIKEIILEGYLCYNKNSVSKEYLNNLVISTLTDVGLDKELINRYPITLSGGQMQRVAIARATILNPKLLLLDEPTSSLDMYNQNKVLELLIRLHKKNGISIIFVSHDINLVSSFCNKMLVLKSGRLVETGNTSEIIKKS